MWRPVTVKDVTKQLNEQRVLAAQLFIQNNLGGDLSLEAISRAAGTSPSHLHRLFKLATSETIKSYSDRLRSEKSIYDLKISGLNLLQISIRYGFQNPETYSRVFKRHIGQSPSQYLLKRKVKKRRATSVGINLIPKAGLRASRKGDFAITYLNELHLAFVRNIGPYEEVPLISKKGVTPWRIAVDFAARELKQSAPIVYLGIPQDSPTATPPIKQRFDCCVVVERPFSPKGKIGYQTIGQGYYGVLTHAGPYSTLRFAYEELFETASTLKRFSIDPKAGLFELMIDISATTPDDLTWTEIYIPLTAAGEHK